MLCKLFSYLSVYLRLGLTVWPRPRTLCVDSLALASTEIYLLGPAVLWSPHLPLPPFKNTSENCSFYHWVLSHSPNLHPKHCLFVNQTSSQPMGTLKIWMVGTQRLPEKAWSCEHRAPGFEFQVQFWGGCFLSRPTEYQVRESDGTWFWRKLRLYRQSWLMEQTENKSWPNLKSQGIFKTYFPCFRRTLNKLLIGPAAVSVKEKG